MTADWCSQVLQQTLADYPAPMIFNTDQGSQFTADIFTTPLQKANVQISMDGKGRAIDNIFVERLWRTVKYEDIYLKAYADGWQLEYGLQAYFEFYNCRRFHQALAYQTPEQVFKGRKSTPNQVENKIN
jgi:putative transposase